MMKLWLLPPFWSHFRENSTFILQLTDFRGEPYPYDKNATWPDEYGVLATAIESDHEKYLKIFPEDIKGQIKDYYKKK